MDASCDTWYEEISPRLPPIRNSKSPHLKRKLSQQSVRITRVCFWLISWDVEFSWFPDRECNQLWCHAGSVAKFNSAEKIWTALEKCHLVAQQHSLVYGYTWFDTGLPMECIRTASLQSGSHSSWFPSHRTVEKAPGRTTLTNRWQSSWRRR